MPVSPVSAAAMAAAAFLGGCSGGSSGAPSSVPAMGSAQTPVRAIPDWLVRAPARPFRAIAAPDSAQNGIYVSAFDDTSIFGFKSTYKTGHGPLCTVYTGVADIGDIAVDPQRDLVVPDGFTGFVRVYKGPEMCGSVSKQVVDPYGQPNGAASLNAESDAIVVSNIVGVNNKVGNLAICTLSGGCTAELTSSNITGYASGVALAKNGACWLASENAAFTAATMTYWAGCSGTGQAVTGFKNSSYGSLSIDKGGNLISLDFEGSGTGQLWVYSGCNPACRLVAGPFPLVGQPIEGALNAKGDTFGTIETQFPYGGQVDIYKYAPTKLTYEYSFDSSYAPVADPNGFAYSPALRE
jgi:hypothetical protein